MKQLIAWALVALLGVGGIAGNQAFAASDNNTEPATKSSQEVMLGEDETTWSPYTLEDEEKMPMVGEDESTWSPFAECDTLEDARNVAGFDMTAPKEIAGYADIHYAAMRNDLIQVDYIADEDTCICIRKGIGTEDISGDWNKYSERQEIVLDGNTVTLQGNNGEVSLATWTDETYAYSVGVYYGDNGIAVSAMKDIIGQIK